MENVRFEDVHRGGIVLLDAALVEKWKNVTYGDGCLSKDSKELVRVYKGKVNRVMKDLVAIRDKVRKG